MSGYTIAVRKETCIFANKAALTTRRFTPDSQWMIKSVSCVCTEPQRWSAHRRRSWKKKEWVTKILLIMKSLSELKLDILGQIKYAVIYEGYCVTVFMLLLASLDFGESCNMRLTSFTAILHLQGHTEATHWRLLWVSLVGWKKSSICRESGTVVAGLWFSPDTPMFFMTAVMDHTDRLLLLLIHSCMSVFLLKYHSTHLSSSVWRIF